MKIAITGGTGFLGRYVVQRLAQNHECVCWYRTTSDRTGLDQLPHPVSWIEGALGDYDACRALLHGADVLVHSALEYPAQSRMLSDAFTTDVALHNLSGSLQLFEAARTAGVRRVIHISSCAVHDKILADRPLDENHPLWPASHYGAHKAAIEAFVMSYALGDNFEICALRPTGIYGIAHPIQLSKWYDLIARIVRSEDVVVRRGGKEVHADDVAKAVELLLTADRITGQAYNCYDRYISEYDVAHLAKEFASSGSEIQGAQTQPKHEIENGKLCELGMEFGGQALFEKTVQEMVEQIRTTPGLLI